MTITAIRYTGIYKEIFIFSILAYLDIRYKQLNEINTFQIGPNLISYAGRHQFCMIFFKKVSYNK